MPDVTVTPTLTISATAPAAPAAGDLWWKSDIGVFFVYYDDGTSIQWVTTQPVKYINLAQIEGPAGGDLTGYYPNPLIEDNVALEYPVLRNPLLLNDYTQKLASTKWVTDMFASFGLLGQVTSGDGILLTPDPLAGDSTIALRPIGGALVPGEYGSASTTAVFEVDQYGRVIEIAQVAIPPVNSPTFTGIPIAPTAAVATDTGQIATTAFVHDLFDQSVPGTYAPLNSPVFTGDPRAPNPAFSDDDTSIATTSWVRDLIAFSPGAVIFSGADGFPTTDPTNFFFDDAANTLRVGGGAIGRTKLNPGAAAQSGYVSFHRADDTRVGYVGWGQTSIDYVAEVAASFHRWYGPGTILWGSLNNGQLTLPGIDYGAPDVNIINAGGTTDAAIQGRIFNADTGNTAVARLAVELSGVANAYGLLGIYKNAGTPYIFIDAGSAVTDLRVNKPMQVLGAVQVQYTQAIPAGGTLGGGVNFSTTANFGINFGSGAPDKAMARGSIYLRSDGLPYFNNDGTAGGWAPLGGTVTVSDTAPLSPNAGQLWYNSALGNLFIYYNDGNTSQWVVAAPAANPPGVQYPFNVRTTAADTLSGPGNMALFRGPALSTPVKDYDPNGVWDIANNRFTAPVNGRFVFHFQAYMTQSGAAQTAVYLVHSNSAGTLIRQYAAAQFTDASYGSHYHISMELEMTAADRVHFQVATSAGLNVTIAAVPGTVGGMPASGALTWVSGHKIG